MEIEEVEEQTCYNCGEDKREDMGVIFRDWEDETEGVFLCFECINEKCPGRERVIEKVVEVPVERIRVMGFSEPIL